MLKNKVLMILVSLVVACGGGDSTPPQQDGTVHGCVFSTATDMTGQSSVAITDISAWPLPNGSHKACIVVDQGATVTWTGSFSAHPLVGGTSPTPDTSSPIGQTTGSTAAITFNNPGDFPYFCGNHPSIMRGVVYVR